MATVTLIPKRATMTAKIFENPHLKILPTLLFEIEIFLRPFKYDRKIQQTSVRLDIFSFGVNDWRELPGRAFTFPKNPDEGYIDGSVYLAGFHNPADATRIRFGALKGRALPAELDIEFDFTYEGLAELGKIAVTWQVELKVDPPVLNRVSEEARRVVENRKRQSC